MLKKPDIKNNSKKILRFFLIILIYLLIICVLLEVGLRIALPHYFPPGQDSPNIWQYDENYGWIGRPNIDTRFRQPAFDIQVQHNSLGHRAKEYPARRNTKKRMLVVGDSFVWCYGVQSSECFVDILEKKNPNWEIINIGVAGTGTDQQYLILKDRIEYYKPDVVMLLFIQNDFQDNMSKENHNYYKPYFTLENKKLALQQIPVPTPRLDQTLERWIYGRSYLYNTSNYLRLIITNIVRESLGYGPVKWEPYAGFTFQSSFEITQALLNAMTDVSEQHHATFVVVHGQMLELLHLVIKQTTDARSVDLHNLDRAFEGHVHAEYQIPGDAHWNAFGHQLVANDIDKFLHEIRIFPDE